MAFSLLATKNLLLWLGHFTTSHILHRYYKETHCHRPIRTRHFYVLSAVLLLLPVHNIIYNTEGRWYTTLIYIYIYECIINICVVRWTLCIYRKYRWTLTPPSTRRPVNASARRFFVWPCCDDDDPERAYFILLFISSIFSFLSFLPTPPSFYSLFSSLNTITHRNNNNIHHTVTLIYWTI